MEMPADPGPEDCEVKYSGKGVTTIGEDIHCRAFEVSNKHVVRIDAPVTIVCDMFEVKNRARISVLEGGSLTVYVRERGRIENHSEVNMNSADSSRVTIYNLSCHEFEVQNSSEMYARLVSPSAPVRLKNHAHLYGQFTGESACLSNRSGMHIEQGVTICGAVPEDIFGVYGVASSGGIPSAAALDTWFIDAPGQNFAISHTITLTRSATNPIWQFNSSSFYPIENKGFGKEAQLHNFYFTFAATLRFRHHACSGGFVDFSGNDDAWLFINGELAMDRGGIQPGGVAQYVEIDRMGLQDGQTYDMHFFYVQRSTLMSNFRLRTNLELIAE
jgi:fibro-slime domain-containing protein